MKILAVDTATASCSVALLNGRQVLAEQVYTAGNTQSRHLMAIVQGLMGRCHWGPGDVDGIAVTRGPGTFTGLRIGISTVKGLAAALGVPVVGVSSLSALAYPLAWIQLPVVAMIDARRGEIYHASFGTHSGTERIDGAARVATPETAAAGLTGNAVLVGSGALLYRNLFETRCPGIQIADDPFHLIRAASVGLMALDRFEARDADPLDALVPEYIRKSDAQIQMSGSC